MTPGPSRHELIATIRGDAASADPIAQLATASQTVAELEDVIDAALAHFVEQCRASGRSWSEISKALGVTKQAAHKRFSPGTPTLERFTQRARRLLPGSVAEAQELCHHYVGTEHILLALFADAECLAAKVLSDLNITRAAVERDLLAITPADRSRSTHHPSRRALPRASRSRSARRCNSATTTSGPSTSCLRCSPTRRVSPSPCSPNSARRTTTCAGA